MSSCYVYYVTILENQWKLTQCITIHIDDTIRISWALTINTIDISPYRYTSINQTSWLLQMMIMNIWWEWTLCIPNDKAFFSSIYIIYRNCLEKNPMETMKSGQRMTLNPTSDKRQPDLFLALWHESMKSKFINTNQFS